MRPEHAPAEHTAESLPVARAKSLVRLVPLQPQHTAYVYSMAVDDPQSWRWRYRGVVPPPQEFERSMWADVAAGFAVASSESSNSPLVGLAFLYGMNLRDMHAFLAIQLQHDTIGSGLGIGATMLLAEYARTRWPLRHLYLEVPSFNLPQFKSAWSSGLLSLRSRFPEHLYFDRMWHDLLTFELMMPEEADEPSRRGLTRDFDRWIDEIMPQHLASEREWLELDSLQVIIVAEELSVMSGHQVSEDAVASLETVGQLRDLWQQFYGAAHDAESRSAKDPTQQTFRQHNSDRE